MILKIEDMCGMVGGINCGYTDERWDSNILAAIWRGCRTDLLRQTNFSIFSHDIDYVQMRHERVVYWNTAVKNCIEI